MYTPCNMYYMDRFVDTQFVYAFPSFVSNSWKE